MGVRMFVFNPARGRGSIWRRAPWQALLALLMGPLVLAALLLMLAAVAFNLWPTLNRMSEWGD